MPAPTGELAISSVAVAVAAVPSATTPAGTSKNTTQPDAVEAVAFGAGIMFASRNFGPDAPAAPASTMFDAATPAFGVPASSTRCISSTPFAADGVTPNPVASEARKSSPTAWTLMPSTSSEITSISWL